MKKLGILIVMALFIWGCAEDDSSEPTLPGTENTESDESPESGDESAEVTEGGATSPLEGGGEEETTGGEQTAGGEETTGGEQTTGGDEEGDDTNGAGGEDAQCLDASDCSYLNTDCSSADCVDGECVVSNNDDGSGCGAEIFPGECISGYECQAGQCVDVPVADGVGCTADGEVGECQVSVCASGACVVQTDDEKEGLECESIGDQGICAVAQCVTGACTSVPEPDDKSCDDGDVCTVDAKCLGGDCKSGIVAPCDDDNACTSDDKCLDADCVGQLKDCDDGDSCTLDSCNPDSGECEYEDDTQTPTCPLYDGDGDDLVAKDDNCPQVYNPKQVDWNDDGKGDACEVDACLNTADIDAYMASKAAFQAAGGQGNTPEDEAIYSCMGPCSANDAACTMAECVGEATGLSPECGGCLAFSVSCRESKCNDLCQQGADWSLCEACVEENCAPIIKECTGLGQGKPSEGCPDLSEEYCDATCWPAGWFDATAGNGMCEEAMACESKGFDGGDCQTNEEQAGQCGGGSVPDCLDGCVLPESIGNGSCEPFLNCAETNWDGGDCSPTCDAGAFLSCDLLCVGGSDISGSLSDGECNQDLNCETYSFDGGDCASSSCGSAEVKDCTGTCTPWSTVSSKLGNGSCDMEYICEAWNNDMNGCEGSCLTGQDIGVLDGKTTDDLSGPLQSCFFSCGVQASGDCATDCIMSSLGITQECSFCFADFGSCIFQNCGLACNSDPNSQDCQDCTFNSCKSPLEECSGLPF